MKKILAVLLVALLFRIPLIFLAYHGDLNNNISWGEKAVERGLAGFYEGENWPYSAPNQPPLTLLTFASARLTWSVVENMAWWFNRQFPLFPSSFIWFWEGKGMILLVKLPSVLADFGIAWLIYKYFSDKNRKLLGERLAAVWLFNPVSWYNSSVWGQTDAVVNFLGLAAVLFLLRRNLLFFSFFLTLSVLFKGSLVVFVPILFFIVLSQRYSVREWVKSFGLGLMTIIVVTVWFHPSLDLFDWVFNLYQKRILPGEIGYLTANAFNFWWLVDSGRTLDSTFYFGLPARVWGFLITAIGAGWLILRLKRSVTEKNIFLSLAFFSLITFLFMTRIHERYLYPFFPSATILLGLVEGFVVPLIIFSITYLLNLYHLFWVPSMPVLEATYQMPLFIKLISIINILAFVYVLRLSRTSRL